MNKRDNKFYLIGNGSIYVNNVDLHAEEFMEIIVSKYHTSFSDFLGLSKIMLRDYFDNYYVLDKYIRGLAEVLLDSWLKDSNFWKDHVVEICGITMGDILRDIDHNSPWTWESGNTHLKKETK